MVFKTYTVFYELNMVPVNKPGCLLTMLMQVLNAILESICCAKRLHSILICLYIKERNMSKLKLTGKALRAIVTLKDQNKDCNECTAEAL